MNITSKHWRIVVAAVGAVAAVGGAVYAFGSHMATQEERSTHIEGRMADVEAASIRLLDLVQKIESRTARQEGMLEILLRSQGIIPAASPLVFE